jgi:integrase/recombinase XerD
LRCVDRLGKAGRRDYAVLHLMAYYGLRPAEVAGLRIDAVDWTAGTLRIEQRKTHSVLTLPLAPRTVRVLIDYLDNERADDVNAHPALFLGIRCPAGPMRNTAICEIFKRRARQSGLNLQKYSAYSLRHAFAMRLLTQGVGVKVIGDVLGHRNLESTCAYLRLDIKALRGVALDLPSVDADRGGRHAQLV